MRAARAAAFALAGALALAPSARSAPLTYAEARDILTHSDRVAVEHLRAVLYSVKDARGAERRRYRTERVSMAEADTAWGHAFARALLAAGPSDSLKRCAPRPALGDTVDAFTAGVTFHAGRRSVGVMLFFASRCAQVFGADGPAASIDLGTNAQALLERVQAALPADSAFGRLAMAEPLPADSAGRAFPLAVAGDVDSLPRALVTWPPKWPADAPGPGPVEVRVLALIDENGTPAAVRAREPRPPFDAAAVDAVRRWRFQPARRGGQAVKAWVEIPVRFEVR